MDIDNEIKKIIIDCMDRADKILADNLDLLNKLSSELLEREILDSEEIEKIMRGEVLPPAKRNGADLTKSDESQIPDHVQALLEEKKKRSLENSDKTNDSI